MTSTLSPPEPAPVPTVADLAFEPIPFEPIAFDLEADLAPQDEVPVAMVEPSAFCLPAHGTTAIAEEWHPRLVAAADAGDAIAVDASEAETIGQAMLQLLVAARADALGHDRAFTITNPSRAFSDRVTGCALAQSLGLITEEENRP
jgi:anti-anti-sigma regulatory factor